MQLGNGLDSLRATLSSIFNLQVEPKHNQTVWWNAINLFYTGLALQKWNGGIRSAFIHLLIAYKMFDSVLSFVLSFVDL